MSEQSGTPSPQVHAVCFEGPDPYARAGGLASRIDGLTRALASLGLETHLWFVGDPDAPGHEEREGVHLHRWCQWLSRGCPGGVYEGEDAKRHDFAASLPPFLLDRVLLPALARGAETAILAEEWHTADCVLHLDRRLREAGVRERVALLWNANNLFGFDRIPWPALAAASAITTVSRAMRQRMEPLGVDPLVLPNGLPDEAFDLPERRDAAVLRGRLEGRLALAKVARWDPDKNWLGAVAGVARLRDAGLRPLLIARGGAEEHEVDVREAASAAGLRWRDRPLDGRGAAGLADALAGLEEADVVCLRAPLDGQACRTLFRGVGAVLADSLFEPFGLVALETMAVGGVACTGLSGEDYAIPGRNALVLQTRDPRELVGVLARLRAHPEEERRLRRSARITARQYAWTEVARRVLLPRLALMRSPAHELPARANGLPGARPAGPAADD